MATICTFRASGVCGFCRAYGRLDVDLDFGSSGATHRIGDDVDDEVGKDYQRYSRVVKEPGPGEPAHVLATATCDTCRRYSWAELVIADGWLVDLRPVELTVETLDRIHYIPVYEDSQLETELGRSLWEGTEIWSEWLPALRAELARKAAAAPEVHEEGELPLGATLDGGRYTIVEHYLGGDIDQLWFARSRAEPNARFLVSTTSDNGFVLDRDAPPLMKRAAGLFTPRFVGELDQGNALGFVEEVSPGWPLPSTHIATELHAFRIGAQIADKLAAAVADGVMPLWLRPEYVWVTDRVGRPVVTGVGGCNGPFFAAAGRRRDLPTARLFTRTYVAPEVHRGEPHDERALVLTLAVMTAEWFLGRYPYDEGDGTWGYSRLLHGEHVELPERARELAPALDPDPAKRPDLAAFSRTLELLARSR